MRDVLLARVLLAATGVLLPSPVPARTHESACGVAAIASLQKQLLSSPDERSTLIALTALRACPSDQGMPVLCDALRKGVESWRVRVRLINAIAPPVPLPPAHACVVPALIDIGARDVPSVRVMAAEALLRFDPVHAKQLVEPLTLVVAQHRWLDAVPPLDPMGGTASALRLLARIGPAAAPAEAALVAALEADDSELRLLACRALAALGPAGLDAVSALRRARHDPYYDVAAEAEVALRAILAPAP